MNAINMARTSAVASHEVALKRLERIKNAPIKVIAYHEASHAVAALAVGAGIQTVRLLPTPRVAIDTALTDDYQHAVVCMAGLMSDWFCGRIPPLGSEQHKAWMLRRLGKDTDTLEVMACAARAAEVAAEDPSRSDKAAVLAWAYGVDILTNRIVCENWRAIGAVSRALQASPNGLAAAEVRQAAGPLRTVARDVLHETLDSMARSALENEKALCAALDEGERMLKGVKL